MAKFILFSVVLLSVALHEGSAKLKCYQCTSTSLAPNDPCYDPLSRSTKDIKPMTCSDDLVSKFIDILKIAVSTEPLKPVCMKTDIQVGKAIITRRECAMVPKDSMKFQERCYDMVRETGGKLSYCGICEKDGCNLASGLQAVTLTALLLLSTLLTLA